MNTIAIFNLTYFQILTQFIGFLAMFLTFASFQKNTNKAILTFQIFSTLFFALHFLMLCAYAGCAMNLLAVIRNIILYNRKRKWASHKLWLYVFLIVFTLAGILTWTGPKTLIIIIAMILNTFAVYTINPKQTRHIQIGASVGWFIYNVISFSIAGVANEFIVLISIFISMFRYDFRKK